MISASEMRHTALAGELASERELGATPSNAAKNQNDMELHPIVHRLKAIKHEDKKVQRGARKAVLLQRLTAGDVHLNKKSVHKILKLI